MRLRDLRKLVEEFAAGSGSGVLEMIEADEVTFHTPTPENWPAVADSDFGDYLPIGPLHLPEAGPWFLTIYAEIKGNEGAMDFVTATLKTVEPGLIENVTGAAGQPVRADWRTSAWEGGGVISNTDNLIWAVGPTDVYALFATTDQPGITHVSEDPVVIRHRRLAATRR